MPAEFWKIFPFSVSHIPPLLTRRASVDLFPPSGSFHASDILSVFALDPLSPVAEFQSRWIAFANTLNRTHPTCPSKDLAAQPDAPSPRQPTPRATSTGRNARPPFPFVLTFYLRGFA